ncbi:hypothetical protein pb186bvf_005453 [Paramecium bursaria]
MNIPNPKPLPLLAQDNTKIKAEVQQAFSRGDMKWSTGATVEDKQDGLNLILGGLKTMKIWISREFDQAYVQTLNQQYQARYDDVKKKLDYLEDYKSGKVQVKTENNSQILQKQGDKDKTGGKDEEKEKMQGALSDAIVTEKPNVKWTDIAGLEAAKGALQEAVIIPIRFPQIFEGPREPWKGILMYGPPGTGKTFMAKACATEADGTFFSVSSSDLISKYVGESEKLIRTLFNMAREKKPSIIFIDEIDSMCGARGEGQNDSSRRVITEFLVQMQGVGHDDKGVLVLGATNLPWALDEAIRRRFQKRIYIPLPDQPARAYIIKNSIKKIKHTLTDDDINVLASKTDGYSGSDIKNFVTDAVYQPVRKLQTAKKFRRFILDGQQKITPAPNDAQGPDIVEMSFMDIQSNELFIPDISFKDFEQSLQSAKKSVGQELLVQFEKWTKDFGQEGN